MPDATPPPNIVLIGFMGSGKSSVGTMLARRLGFQFLDTDKLIEERARMAIKDIFARYGEVRFRERETAALESLAGLRRHVLATGGGIVTRPENVPLLHRLGWVVLLKADSEEIFKRVCRNRERPLLQVANPRARVNEMLAAREPLYAAAADFTVDSTGLRREDVVETIVQAARSTFGWKASPRPSHQGTVPHDPR